MPNRVVGDPWKSYRFDLPLGLPLALPSIDRRRRKVAVSESTKAGTSRAVLITGCSSGIGWATAERLAEGGWTVYATARNVEAIAPLEARGCK